MLNLNINKPTASNQVANQLKRGSYKGTPFFTAGSVTDGFSLDNFSRNSVASINSTSGVTLYAADQLRSNSSGMLFESSRENIFTQSSGNIFTDTGGTITLTENNGTSPDGTNTLFTLERVSSFPYIFEEFTGITTDEVVSCSCYFSKESSGSTLFTIWFLNGGTQVQHRVTLNLNSGEITGTAGSPTNVIVEEVGDFWWIQFTGTNNSTGNTRLRWTIQPVDTGVTYGIWGYQCEKNSFGSSLIPTSSGAVTRSADICELPNSFNKNGTLDGTITLGFKFIHNTPQALFSCGDTTDGLHLYIDSSQDLTLDIRQSSSSTKIITGVTKNTDYETIITFKNDTVRLILDGSEIGSESSISLDDLGTYTFTLGSSSEVVEDNNFYISKLLLYPYGLL